MSRSTFSEDRTYILNDMLIFITKVKKVQIYEKANTDEYYLITFENLLTKEQMTVKEELLDGAIKTIDSVEFFDMWCQYNNWRERCDDNYEEYAIQHCINVINLLKERKIELHGSNKFELCDLNHANEMYKYIYESKFCSVFSSVDCLVHDFDGGYTYNVLYTPEQRLDHDRKTELSNILNHEIQVEIDRELLESLNQHIENDPLFIKIMDRYT